MGEKMSNTITSNMIRNALNTFGVSLDDMPDTASADDPVNHPTHYTYGSIECIDFIDSCGYGLDFCIANAIKYLTRCKHKGTCEQDIRKAIWYATHAADGLKNGMYKINEK